MLDGRISLNVPYIMNKDAEILFFFEREGGWVGGWGGETPAMEKHPIQD